MPQKRGGRLCRRGVGIGAGFLEWKVCSLLDLLCSTHFLVATAFSSAFSLTMANFYEIDEPMPHPSEDPRCCDYVPCDTKAPKSFSTSSGWEDEL